MKLRVTLWLVLVLTAASLEAAPKSREQKLVTQWQEQLVAADEAIATKDYDRAAKLAQGLLDAFDQRLAGGPDAKKYYAAALVRRALAAAGQARHIEAQWDWDVAKAYLPEIPATTFDPSTSAEGAPGLKVFQATDQGVMVPVILHRVPPRYTVAARYGRLTGTVVLELVIDEQGRLRSPKVRKSLDSGLDFAALESIRQWRFQPATLKGEPIAVYYVVTIQFKISEKSLGGSWLVSPTLGFPLRAGPQTDSTEE
ncbi:MAG: energy transducer TonB [Thermoanaerobaculia bacterium]|nr:energy transducer TonB [Thermoanaerobaculia bacterium]